MRISKVIMCLFIILSLTLVPAYADTANSAASDVETVIELIDSIDPDSPDQDVVKEARDLYESLTMAQKMQVTNIDVLEGYEGGETPSPDPGENTEENGENTGEHGTTDEPSVNPEEEDKNTQKTGTKYTFHISEYNPQATLVISFLTDSDGDGIKEVPEITVITPDNTEMILGDSETGIFMEGVCDIDVIKTESFIQFDIAEAANGNWTFITSNRVFFKLSEYMGNTDTSEFTEVDPEDEGEGEEEGEQKMSPLPLILLLGAFAAVIIAIKLFPFGGKKPKTKKTKDPVKAQTSEDDDLRPPTPEEEIQRIKAEWESMRDAYRDEEPEPAKPKKTVAVEEDDRMFVTQADIDDDDSIEYVDDDDMGFFGKARFDR